MINRCLIIVFFVLGDVLVILYGLANVVAGYPGTGTVLLVLGSIGIIIAAIQHSRQVKRERGLQDYIEWFKRERRDREDLQRILKQMTPASPLPSNLSVEEANEVLQTRIKRLEVIDYVGHQGCLRVIEKNNLSAILHVKRANKRPWKIFKDGVFQCGQDNEKDAEEVLMRYMTWQRLR
jgi:hypothetical protein